MPSHAGGGGDLLGQTQPGADGGGGEEVRGRQDLGEPQEQTYHPQRDRSLPHHFK